MLPHHTPHHLFFSWIYLLLHIASQFLHLAVEPKSFWTVLKLFHNVPMGPTKIFLVLLVFVKDIYQASQASRFLVISCFLFYKIWELALVGSSLHPLGLVACALLTSRPMGDVCFLWLKPQEEVVRSHSRISIIGQAAGMDCLQKSNGN